MRFSRKWILVAFLVVCVAAASVLGFVIPSTIAYLANHSNTVINLFDAPYTPPEEGGVDVQVQKIITAIGEETISPEGFQFLLQNAENQRENYTLTADSMGQAGLRLFFAEKDVGKEFRYQLSEINDGRDHVIYSDLIYDIRLLPVVDEKNEIHVLITVNGVAVQGVMAQFENLYAPQPEPPVTGDGAPVIIFAALLLISAGGVMLLMKKRHALGKE